ncbi:hypothetical protein Tco_1546366 [Tanacetum coccineum]
MERKRQRRNEDLRTKLEYFSEEYDEEREMEPRPTRVHGGVYNFAKQASSRVRRQSERVIEIEDAPNKEGSRSMENTLDPLGDDLRATPPRNPCATLSWALVLRARSAASLCREEQFASTPYCTTYIEDIAYREDALPNYVPLTNAQFYPNQDSLVVSSQTTPVALTTIRFVELRTFQTTLLPGALEKIGESINLLQI